MFKDEYKKALLLCLVTFIMR